MRHALIVVALLLIAACGGDPPTPAPAVPTTPAGAASYVPPPPEIAVEDPAEENEDGRALRFGDGTYVVGVQVAPGYYRALGRAPDRPLCSWSIADSDTFQSQSGPRPRSVASGIARAELEPQRIALRDGEVLTTTGCGEWLYYGP